MLLSKDFYDQCCPSYQKAIDVLEQKLDDIEEEAIDEATATEQFRSAIWEFSRNYLTPNEYWENCINYIDRNNECANDYEKWKKHSLETVERAYFNLHFNAKWVFLHYDEDGYDYELTLEPYGDKSFKFLDFSAKFVEGYLNNDDDYEDHNQELDYPHSHLKECFCSFERNEPRLLSKKIVQKYEEMKVLYLQIKSAENDIDTWFKLLLEVGDNDFVKDNVEYRLGKNLLDAKLWKLYIQYLKEHGEYKLLLEVYSKYCRFFLDDHEMLEEYKGAVIKYGHVNLQWDNRLFEFEASREENEEGDDVDADMDVSTSESSKSDDSDVEMKEFDKNLCKTFYDTYRNQDFAFRGPLIAYILNNASHQILRKLFNSCKYFYVKKPTPICYRLESYTSKSFFDAESLFLQHSINPNLFLNNTYITTSICVERYSATPPNFISSVIPHLYRCDAKYIYLHEQNLSFKELKFLIQHGNVIEMDFTRCLIKHKNGDYVNLELIVGYLPNIEKLSLYKVKTNENTAHALANQKFNGKIHRFSLYTIEGEPFNIVEFLNFCTINRNDLFSLYMDFNNNFNAAFVKDFAKNLKKYEKSCKNTSASAIRLNYVD